MTDQEKIRFLRELTDNVVAEAIRRVPDMPDDWDGHELRRYLADKFDDAAMTVGRKGPFGKDYAKRTKAYRNTVLVSNL